MKLDFFDSNCYIGLPMNRPVNGFGPSMETAGDLLQALDRAGIQRALVWHIAQREVSPVLGNRMLSDALAGHEERLAPIWTILPPQTRELGTVDEFLAAARVAGVRAFRAFPDLHRYLLRREVVGALLDRLVAARAPLILRPGDVGWETIYNLLAATPGLTVIVTDMGVWNNDRQFRPLIERYPDVYIETTGHITDGGIEAFVESYGPERLLYGSGFPESYHGGMMLALRHAEIADAAKRAIAGGNLERLLAGVRL